MFDIDSGKLLIIAIVALVVIGPKELPGVMRQVGLALAKVRRMASEFQGQFMEAMRESELEELKKDVQKISDSANYTNFDPLAKVKDKFNEVNSSLEATLAAPVAPVETAELSAPDAPPGAAADLPAPEPAPAPTTEPEPAPIKTGGTA